ncbi:hypothetical protein [Halodesulfovibrio sp.]|uniref:hypothetical protein n=1 Tax=Halodesulfovibrio sp. TaxID=1912772 RepID=UPI0025C39BB3|nr:hypothetical protein [Halodesulfovibrio sp.]
MSKRRYRKISVCIWNDAKFMALSNDAKLIVFFMLTHPDLTQLGALRANVPGLACELGMELEAFTKGFEEVLNQGIVKHDGKLLFWFPNFLRYNLPESPNVVTNWQKGYDGLPESPLKDELLIGAKALVDGLSKAFQEAFTKAFAETLVQPSPNHRAYNIEHREEDIYGETPSEPSSDSGVDLPAEPEPLLEPEAVKGKTKAQEEEEFLTDVAAMYNAILVDEQPEGRKLPKLIKLSDKRKKLIRARMKFDAELRDIGGWETYFTRVHNCPYLMGEVNSWSAYFDWLLDVNNMLRIQEGAFLPKQGKKKAAPKPAGGSSVAAHNDDVFADFVEG